jgi:predicted ATPase/class 3 adenylate cyclase
VLDIVTSMRELPTGTVTFFFTDIEGSTRLLHELGMRYHEALAQHHRVLRAAIGEAGGVEVSTHGDAFFAAFTDPDAAVTAATIAQRELTSQTWPDERELRVRIGIHTGVGTVGADDYIGIDVHTAARVCSAAHGGQVLVTRATYSALHRDTAFLELGHHVLKDLESPVELFQPVAKGLRREFPPLKTLTNANLPEPPTPIVGRTREVHFVRDLVLRDDTRLVTLTGPGGTGKTRLALEVARELVEKFPNGVTFVALGGIASADVVLPVLGEALGVEGSSGRPLERALEDYLRERQLLLVLDNFEHVLGAAPAIAKLLAATPGVTALVTSRERLHLSGEHELAVPPLRPSDAIALFNERARAALPTFEDNELDRAAIEEICRRLDGLPLAIELAAARVKLLSPRALQGRLGRRLQLLTGGARDLPERQQTLRATIDWSYELLEATEQRLLARLAVFTNGCTLEAAEDVCDASLDDLASLVDKSLLNRDVRGTDIRFVLLETIREYAFERLREHGELDELRRRHAGHYLGFAEQANEEIRGAGQARWLAALDVEHSNLRAALDHVRHAGEKELELRFVSALWFFWIVHGHLTQGMAIVERALEGSTNQSPELRADALKAVAALAHRLGDTRRAKLYAKESIGLYRTLGDLGGEASALTTLGGVALVEGDGTRARELYEQALGIARNADDPFRLASALGNLGYLLLMEGHNDRAAQLFEEGLIVFRRLSSEEGVARSLLNLGFAAWQRSSHVEAEALMKESVRRFTTIGSREGIAYGLEGLAAVATSRLEAARAARLLGASEAVCEKLELTLDPFEQALHGWTTAQTRTQLGDEAFAAELAAGRALPVDEAAGYALSESAGEAIAVAGG